MAVRGRVESHRGDHVRPGGDLRGDGKNRRHVDIGAAVRQGPIRLTVLVGMSCHDLEEKMVWHYFNLIRSIDANLRGSVFISSLSKTDKNALGLTNNSSN